MVQVLYKLEEMGYVVAVQVEFLVLEKLAKRFSVAKTEFFVQTKLF